MLKPVHAEMIHLALDDQFSPRAIERIIAANLYQDRPRGQVGHPEYHFDDNAFEKSYAYIEEQRALTVSSLMAKDVSAAWSAFGRLIHTAQDFYSHSNYVDLWLSSQPNGVIPAPVEIDPMDPDLIHSPALRTGRIYPLDYLTFFPILKPLVVPLLPRDSHAWMNLDSAGRGPNFPYAFQAAVKRTKIEFESTTKNLSGNRFALFVDKQTGKSVNT
jgi:hypothetical protein